MPVRHIGVTALAILCLLPTRGPAQAQTLKVQSPKQEASQSPYSGIIPKGAEQPISEQDQKGKTRREMRWAGFQQFSAKRSRLYLHADGPLTYTVTTAPRHIEVLIKNVRINLENNQRVLDTRFFETPVMQATIKRQGKNLRWIIELKQDTPAPHISQVVDAESKHFLFVTFE